MAARTIASSAIFLVEQCFVINILSYFTAPLADDCLFGPLTTLKSDCVPHLFACCEAPPFFGATPMQAGSIGAKKAA
jgi:hypothetical protein